MESFTWRVAADVWATLAATWPFLAVSVLAAAALNVYVGTDRLSGWLRRRTPAAVVGAVALATLTPFCSCGTTAVTLGMLASHTPWAPIVAFMVASPLTSPSELVLSGGLLGWPFAWVFFGGTIVLGLVVGAVTAVVERTGWLRDQARMALATGDGGCATSCDTDGGGCATSCDPDDQGCATSCDVDTPRSAALSLGPGAAAITEVGTLRQRLRLDEFGREVATVGRKLAIFFLGFTALGYALIEAIPTEVLQTWLGGDGLGSVVVAAVLGIPAYVNTEGSLPLVAGLMDGGMGPGAAMAFLVTGAGTSIGAIGGMLVIARRRVVGLVVGSLVVGAVVLGWATQLVLG